MAKQSLSVTEVAYMFGVTHQTVYNWTGGGDISFEQIEGIFERKQKEIDERQAELDKARRRFRRYEAESLAAAS